MSAPFPQLLRRSTFAAHDPFISRVYTSPPSSIYQHGDWGLKYPITRTKGPKYIKLSTLDAGKVIGADWRSAETEARFVQSWGTGRVPWLSEEEHPHYESTRGRISWSLIDEYGEPQKAGDRKVELMEDVNAMSPREFETYLEKVRGRRKEYLKVKMKSLGEGARDRLSLPEDKTLVTLATKNQVQNPDTASFQVSLTKEELESADSNVLHSAPHPIHGLSYSRLPSSSSQHNAILQHPGRAIEKVSPLVEASDRARAFRSSEGTNRAWIVGMGNVAAKSKTNQGRIADTPTVDKGVDFTRENRHQGEARWQILTATMKDPPRVLGLEQLTEAQRSVQRGRTESASKKISPLDTFRFDITVDHVSSVQPESESSPKDEVGSREWVAREHRVARLSSAWGDQLGLGGPRSERKQGEGLRQVRTMEEKIQRENKEEGAERITNLLARLNRKVDR